MSTKGLLTGFVVLLAIAAVIPTTYHLRRVYCMKYGRQVGWSHGHSAYHPEEFRWSKQSEADREQLARWSELLRERYSPENDSWNRLSDQERDESRWREFTEFPDRWSLVFLPRVSNPTPGSSYHSIDFVWGSPQLNGAAVSADGKRLSSFSIDKERKISLYWTVIDESGENVPETHFRSDQVGCWSGEYNFQGGHFYSHVIISLEQNSRAFSLPKASSKAFVEDGLKSLDELEAAIVEYLDSDAPKIASQTWVSNVDLKACTCEKVLRSANRALKPHEKAEILSDAKVELDRRRNLLREHGEVWYETLQRVWIDLD